MTLRDYDAAGDRTESYEIPGGGVMHIYEMRDPEAVQKFVAVPEGLESRDLPFFTSDGVREYARRQGWSSIWIRV